MLTILWIRSVIETTKRHLFSGSFYPLVRSPGNVHWLHPCLLRWLYLSSMGSGYWMVLGIYLCGLYNFLCYLQPSSSARRLLCGGTYSPFGFYNSAEILRSFIWGNGLMLKQWFRQTFLFGMFVDWKNKSEYKKIIMIQDSPKRSTTSLPPPPIAGKQKKAYNFR